MKPRKHSAFRRPATLIAVVSFAMSLSAAHAADQTWNPAGPTNNWNTTDLNWDAGVAWTQANNAIFGGVGETVTLTEGIAAGGLTFNSSGHTISGNTLTLAAGAAINTGTNNATIGSLIAGTSFSKSGAGELVLTGASNYSGAVTINAGTLKVAADSLSGAAVNLSTSGAKLNLGYQTTYAWAPNSAVTSGGANANYVIDGNSGTRWSSTTQNCWIYADLGSTQSLGQFAISYEYAYSSAFKVQVSDDATTWTDATGVLNAGGDGLKIYGLNSGTSGRYVRVESTQGRLPGWGMSIWEMIALGAPMPAGTYSLGSLGGAAGTTVDMALIANALNVGSDNTDTTFAGTITGGSAATLEKVGTGTLTLSGLNTYGGNTNVNAGILAIQQQTNGGTITTASGAITEWQHTVDMGWTFGLQPGSVTFAGAGRTNKTSAAYMYGDHASGGTFKVNQSAGAVFDMQAGRFDQGGGGGGFISTNRGSLNVASGATIGLWASSATVDALTGGGTVVNGDARYHVTLTLGAANHTSSVDNPFFSGTSATFSGALANGAAARLALTKTGSGTQILTGTCTYTGATTVNGGTLALAGAATLASPTLTLAEGGRLDTSGLTADFTLATGQTLSAGRTTGFAEDVKGNLVISDGSLHIAGPGNTAGTLTQTGKLTLGGGILKFDLAATDTPGGGVNDLIAVTGDLALVDSTTITINKLTGTLTAGSYTLINCTGALTGNAATNLVLDLADIGRQSYALATTANSVVLNVTGVPANLVWTGASVTNPTFWDQNTTANWSGGPNGKFADGDVVLFDDTATATIVDVQGWMAPISVTFNNTAAKPYSITGMGSIDGATGITKNGNGLVTITTDNTNSGAVALNGGIVSIATGDGLGTGAITIDGGTLAFTGTAATWTRSLTLNAGGGVFDITDIAGELTSTGPFAGVGTLTKAGAGTLVFGAPNNHTGATTITAGTLELRLSTGYTTKSSGYAVAAGAAFTFRMPTTGYDGNLSSPLSGAGTVNLINNGWSMHLNADNSAFTGTLTTSGNSTLFLDTPTATSANTAYIINMNNGGGAYGSLCTMGVASGSTIHLGSLAGSTPTSKICSGYHGPGTLTWSVGALGTDTSFGGYFANYNMTTALTKVGTGTLTLTGANTYTGVTTITQGTLQVDGSIAAGSSVTVQSAATLAGTGTVGGNVSVEAGGFVAPGNAGIGTLTVGSAAITGTYQCQLDVASGDQVAVSGALTVNPGATIAVSTLGPPAAASYVIATYGSLAGGVPAVTGIPSGYVLDTATAGEVKLVKSGGFGAWADSFEGLTDKTPGGDPDNDGIKNLVEYVIGGDPRVSSAGFLPKQAIVGTNLVLSYQRSDASEADTTQTGQWSTNLVDWNNIAPVQVNENDTAPDDMTISIPLSNAAGGKLFGRLQVTMP
jgi:autotransporter-associated beta strand protein